MTNEEKVFFEKLVKARLSHFNHVQEAERVGTVEGYWDSVVDKYSDQAHFIYELLQNADDALARNAHFELFDDHLVFRHDGKKRFSVSDPDTYKQDRKNNKVGDINGITSIGGSTKFVDDAKIGKFGLGFKAVFQYTLTPSIYDGNVLFRIHDYIVPELLNKDYSGRKTNETVFVFPFDRPDVSKKEAVEDIQEKLTNLIFPNLFLNNLETITYDCFGKKGLFKKKIETELTIGDITAQYIVITKGSVKKTDRMWLFTRSNRDNYKYSVGFFVDEDGKITVPDRQYAAFCFFPTLVTTNLNFVIHAPFLLTDNREGIMAGDEHNKNMIRGLAKLAADSIECLCLMGVESDKRIIDDNILDIIPFQENVFFPESDRSKVSFMPFFTEIRSKFQTSEILPIRDGYTTLDKAYWADTEDIPNLLSDEQLTSLLGSEAHFAFVSKGRNSTMHNAASGKGKYIDSIVFDNIEEDDIYRMLDSVFIESQDESWLILFYRYILEGRNSEKRIRKVRQLPIFLDTKGKAISAYDENNHECLFLPDDDETGYPTINAELYKNEHVKKLLSELEIQKPEQEHRIFNKIIPQYADGNRQNGSTLSDFKLFIDYFIECEDEDKVEDLIDSIKDLLFVEAISADGQEKYVATPGRLYMPTPELKQYFDGVDDILFVDLAEYEDNLSKKQFKHIEEFLLRAGVATSARRYGVEYEYNEYGKVRKLFGDDWPYYTASKVELRHWTDYRLIGGEEAVQRIEEDHSSDLSAILWEQLVTLFEQPGIYVSWQTTVILGGVHTYPYYGDNKSCFDGQDTQLFRESSWLVNKKGEFVSPKDLIKDDLSSIYDLRSPGIAKLIKFLGIIEEDDTNLTDSQREKIELANKFYAMGFSEEDLEEFKAFKQQREAQRHIFDEQSDEYQEDDENVDASDEEEYEPSEPISTETQDVIKDIISRRRRNTPKSSSRNTVEEESDVDEDEYTPSTVDYSKKIERAKEKSAAEIEKITYWEGLQKQALDESKNNKYSFKWFNTLLEMESINSGESNANSREVSISFANVEREPGTKRTLVLRHPNRYIPQFMEDLADIPMVLHIGDQTKTVAIEVANIKSYTLRVKLKNSADIDGINLEEVNAVTIDAKSPVFLLEELRKQFSELGFDDDYNMRDNLCENIEFVFGPPGTGKTTHLANNVLIPMMRENKECKVLVLAPTNKAADVLVRRIIEVSGEDLTYKKWLIRFGSTADEDIEESAIYKDKTFDIMSLPKSVTVTTIARFPYDYFMPNKGRFFLNAIKWDYIVIDEASMIPIANIVYPLYKKTPKKFVIAGDPFQIEPITSVDLWKNENIYTLVKLDSFSTPVTVPYQYKVELLTTQYRSVPDIGDIFSKFAYGGILHHSRKADSQRPLNVGNDLGIETLNVIKYPVSKYESIYRCKRLQHSSSYQVYSALFTFEYVCYLSRAISQNNPGQLFKIGIIAPYRAQADMIDKLLASEKLPKEIDVQVGTIHGFQGDECDIIFSVFNTPPTISESRDMFLNKKNIVNVSISRARDYLFIVMPDDNTDNIEKLTLIKRVEELIHDTDAWNEFDSPDLEELMFGDSKYLETNAFSTSHQSVNVYGLPEKCYEVRTEDSAVDVQIHKALKGADSANALSTVSETNSENAYSLDDSVIPEDLRKGAMDLPVKGAINGWCYLVPYEGKLKSYTAKPTEAMFVPAVRNGQEKMITVSVNKADKIIYISKYMFQNFEQELGSPDGIELRKAF